MMVQQLKNRTILNGDVKNKLKEIPDNSIDQIVTDPPYGYSFMNKDWDKVVIGSNVWKECLRVLKPGSFAFIMSAPRQDVLCRVMINLEKAGFVMGFTSIYWAYASGFPKAMNVSKAVDKKLGVKPEIIGKKDNKIYLENLGQAGYKEEWDKTKPTSPQAVKLDGSYAGFQPKPALEVILVCMKPLSEKNYVEQALTNGKGVTWLDDCRIPYKSEKDLDGATFGHNKVLLSGRCPSFPTFTKYDPEENIKANPQGRFPANLLVSDNALDVGKKTKSQRTPKSDHRLDDKSQVYRFGGERNPENSFDDEGDFSRYYSLDSWEAQFIITPKPSKGEKNEGLDAYMANSDKYQGKFPCSKKLSPQKVNDGRKNPPDNPYQRGDTIRQNIHPTVKPVELFKYLILMGSRSDDFILDPFMGSGTTAIACEKLARNWIGIEINEEYCEIIRARIDDYRKQMRLF